jgi:hypothetical protein
MRKWQDLAAPDDPGSWKDVRNMFPNARGTYELGYASTGTNVTATGETNVRYAAALKTLAGSREYVIGDVAIWEYSGILTDRTGGVTLGTYPMMVNYGDVTICVMGAANPTVKSTGGNFSALAGAPQGEIVLIHANVALVFNTNTSADGWSASDVGDYTNWATGESASGRIFDTPGPITAAVAYGGSVYVFKDAAIYRMSYVGNTVKWAIECVWRGDGVHIGDTKTGKYQVTATKRGIAFCGNDGVVGTSQNTRVFLFDGASPPRRLNPLTTVAMGVYSVYRYNPALDTLCIAPAFGSNATGFMDVANGTQALYYYYSFESDAWGCGVGSATEIPTSGTSVNQGVLQGDWIPGTAGSIASNKPVYWAYRGTANTLSRNSQLQATSCYLQSSKVGRVDGQTTFSRLIPLLRRRTDLGTDSASLTFELFNELEDTSAATSRTVTESTNRRRFDLLGGAASAPFGRFKVTWTALDVEVDDFNVNSKFVLAGN